MSYNYKTERERLFTDEGQKDFIAVRDKTKELLSLAGAARMDKMWKNGDSWLAMACADRMIELGEIREITDPTNVPGQHRVFVAVEKTA